MHSTITAVILAAGKGTRMKSRRAKVLHEVFFKPMLHHVLDSVHRAGIKQTVVIVGHQRDAVLASIAEYGCSPVVQEEQLGTGHAVLCTETACENNDQIMILCGDTPLVRPETLQALAKAHAETNSTVTLMTTLLEDPFGYGRIISDQEGNILEIVEQKDADPAQRAIKEINAGIYLVNREFLFAALQQVGTDNSQGEVYLTDIIAIANREGHKVHKFIHPQAIDVLGVNSRVELAQADKELQMRHNRTIMLSGVTLYSPETILIAPNCTIGQDSVIESGVLISGRSTIGSEVHLETGVVLDNCRLGDNSVVGAHSVLHNSTIEEREHIPPLTYRVG
ncbi:MAG TPA: bifunctional N-acetylglucosamine-1-phosphate uridyltransferase/glucosamine-1-phosphate acetyltransferase [Desulfobulbus sp.]|nr:bifunctional N-acetylglucosamine-1-phosphate uridyltransferase/glucosamine-1-phosphate acetyltransferase [Desulfobulbus sp.]